MNLVKNLIIDKLLDVNKTNEFISFSFRKSNLHFLMKSNNSNENRYLNWPLLFI